MPQRHRYKCLNYAVPHVPSRPITFVAMNSPMPECPQCGSRRLEDWGEAWETGVVGGDAHADTKHTDATFRRVADRYGLTDMNNKDGQAVKRPAAPKPVAGMQPGATVNIGGYQVPLSQAASGACVHMPGMAKPISAPINQSTPKHSPMMNKMTNVVAEHKA